MHFISGKKKRQPRDRAHPQPDLATPTRRRGPGLVCVQGRPTNPTFSMMIFGGVTTLPRCAVRQAIRREVAAMGDGVERALARAAELETLVANEVSALEHAYNDNEVRIRALLQDLGSQRDTLVGQADQVRDAINGVHLDLTHDISQISDLVAEQVNDAARRITHTLAEKGEHIARALAHAGDTMIEQLGERGGDLLERLEATGATTAEAIAQASDRLTATLNFKTD